MRLPLLTLPALSVDAQGYHIPKCEPLPVGKYCYLSPIQREKEHTLIPPSSVVQYPSNFECFNRM